MSAQRSPKNEQVSRSQGLDDADYYIKEAFEILQREATSLRQEKEAFNAMSKKFEHVHFSSTVNLNVGGHCFKTSVQTLTKDPNTMLAAMFSGKFEMKSCEDGAFFIDRDGTHFRFILNYLRTGKLTLPEGATFLKELLEEAEFYQIQGIIDELRVSEATVQASKPAKTFEESMLLTNENHQSVLKGWLPSQEGKWRLLYRASRDGFAAAVFHSKCDDKGPTVTIVKSGNNIFGGFTKQSWAGKSVPDFKIASAPFKEFWAQFDEKQYILFKITQSLSYLANSTNDKQVAMPEAVPRTRSAQCGVRNTYKKRN